MKQPIRYFSIGLLIASLIILIVVSYFDKSDDLANKGSVDEMIAALKDEGYHVLSSSEYITLTVASEAQDEDEAENETKEDDSQEQENTENDSEVTEDNEVEEEQEEENAEAVQKYTLTIEPNMLGPTISQLLADNNIIEDADEFNRYLEVEGYAPYLQLGEHDVSSDMSHYEIAQAIARAR